jgi:hypothetical protein
MCMRMCGRVLCVYVTGQCICWGRDTTYAAVPGQWHSPVSPLLIGCAMLRGEEGGSGVSTEGLPSSQPLLELPRCSDGGSTVACSLLSLLLLSLSLPVNHPMNDSFSSSLLSLPSLIDVSSFSTCCPSCALLLAGSRASPSFDLSLLCAPPMTLLDCSAGNARSRKTEITKF